MASSANFSVYIDELRMADADALVENANDPEISINDPAMPYPYTVEYASGFISATKQKLADGDEFHMAIRLGDGKLIGLCALAHIDRANRNAEVGYWIGKGHRGRGYAKEALKLVLGFGFERLGLNRICAKVLPGNERSMRLLESLGFRKEGTNREEVMRNGKFLDSITFGILKREFIVAPGMNF